MGVDPHSGGRTKWLCKCDCQKIVSVLPFNLERTGRCGKRCRLVHQPYRPFPTGKTFEGAYRRPLSNLVSWGRVITASGEDVVLCTCDELGSAFFPVPWEAFEAEKREPSGWDKEQGTHQSWKDAKQRCRDVRKYPGYSSVLMCDEWYYDYYAFRKYALGQMGGLRPCKDLTLHRINGGPYAPGHVKWETKIEQSRDRKPLRSFPRLYADACGDPATI